VCLVQHAGHSCFQRRQLVLNDIPHGLTVDSKIFVNQDIPKPGELFPVDTGSALASFFGEVFRGFPNHLQISHNRIEGLVVLQEVLKGESKLKLGSVLDRPLHPANQAGEGAKSRIAPTSVASPRPGRRSRQVFRLASVG
jgi:hypothetical protein